MLGMNTLTIRCSNHPPKLSHSMSKSEMQATMLRTRPPLTTLLQWNGTGPLIGQNWPDQEHCLSVPSAPMSLGNCPQC
uniref:Uncharacterized protein n=1 Tax=Arundo donax TaxID=35708 RepID=A0A0A9GCS5_ARUDO